MPYDESQVATIRGVAPDADKVASYQNPLQLDLPDDVLCDNLDKRIIESKTWYKNNKKLYERQKKNVDYLFGRVLPDRMKVYESDFLDNAIYEAESSIKPIALSRMPDMLVKPGNDTEESKETAKQLSEIIDNDIKRREHRRVLALAFKHLPVYFTGIIKIRWDSTKGKDGDYVFEVVHPDNVVFDHTAKSNNVDDMDFVAESLQLSVKEAVLRFPKKKEELLKALGIENEENEMAMASKIKIWEVWFRWWEKLDETYKPVEGVLWKYGKVVLDKMKNPNWDWEGEEITKIDGVKADPATLQQTLMDMVMGNPTGEISRDKVYFNYFERPKKPYILLGYDQWGEMPYDETSRIEQVLYLQKDVHKRGKQITEMADRARIKHIFSSDEGVTAEMVQGFDSANPDQDMLVPGDVAKVHGSFIGEQPTAPLFQDKDSNKSAIFQKMGVHDTTRGQKETDTATTSQILREADYGRIDDLTEDTINAAAEEMARWVMQLVKLRYTEDHFVRLLGKDGSTTFVKINRDQIEDGMEVTVSASGVDKLMRKRQAIEMANMKLIDPLTFYEDMEVSNPKERAERVMLFNTDPASYLLKYVQEMDTMQAVNALGQMPTPQQSVPGAEPPAPVPVLPQESIPAPVGQAGPVLQ